MAINLKKFLVILILMYLFGYSSSCSDNTLHSNISKRGGFKTALATWAGDLTGPGYGGACGWAIDLHYPPHSPMMGAGNARLFLKGKGCGTCYQILCTREPYCSRKPVTVTLTNECNNSACNDVPFAFDLNGAAFGAMARPGQYYNLRDLGKVDVKFRRVACNYTSTTKIAFVVDEKVNPYWFAVAVEFFDGYGVKAVEIAPRGSKKFRRMENIWGAVWAANIDPSFRAPFSFRLTSPTNETVVAHNAVSYPLLLGAPLYSEVNFRI